MARRAEETEEHRGVSEIAGLLLICAAFLLLISLFSFDRNDLAVNRVPANAQINNWIGPVGAHMSNAFFFTFGITAYLWPVLLLGAGIGYLVQFFGFLRKRWPWALLLIVATTGTFDLFSVTINQVLDGTLKQNLNVPSLGGYLGITMNDYVFRSYFGMLGSSAIFITLYLVSLIGLTGVQFSEWLQYFKPGAALENVDAMDEKGLEKRARELAKQAKQLEEEMANSGLGADLKPVPEPTVRDLSIPQPGAPTQAPVLPAEKSGEHVGEVITAKEIHAATSAEVLGETHEPQASEAEKGGDLDSEEEPPLPAAALPRPKYAPKKHKPIAVAATPKIINYQLPPMDSMNYPEPNQKPTESKEELMANARLMQNTLAQFDIEVALGDITKGPTITRYELHPAPGVRLEKITALSNNLAAALKAENVSILAPIPGKSSVGIEVPNLVKTKVIMRDLLESEAWQKTKCRIPLALGKDVYGQPIIADLAEMPHLLIAGSTGSGKSVCINSIIASLLMRFTPDELRFVMIDPKVVELQQYNSLPHLVVPVVTDPKKVVLALRWVVTEMEKRYQIFARVGVRNIKSFNERPRNKPAPPAQSELPLLGKKERVETNSDGFAVELDEEIVVPRDDDIIIPEKLSYVVVIIDELADLMLVAPADVEMAIARITQMARAAGIHCIVATQRPSVDVITGVIKANIPARIAFQVAAKVDSRTILDAMGADKLLGKGDMLYLPPGSSKLTRAQGVLITDQELQGVVDFIAKQAKPSYELEIHQQLSKPVESGGGDGCDEDESLIEQCIEVIRSEQKASVSLMQRRLRLGYTRAARIMDELENRGIVGPNKGAEPRDILIDLDAPVEGGPPV
jgi:DNA segregation ATPase FtsK/SpoIIIE, S-DNA-T family